MVSKHVGVGTQYEVCFTMFYCNLVSAFCWLNYEMHCRNFFIFSKAFRLVPGLTQPIQRVPGAFGDKAAGA